MSNINSRLNKIEEKLNVKKEPVIFRYTDENGIEQKIEMTWDEWENLIKNIPPTKGVLPSQEKLKKGNNYYE